MIMIIQKREDGKRFYKKLIKQKTFNNRTGDKYNMKLYGKCVIIHYTNTDNVQVTFLNTGYVTNTTISNLRRGIVKDYLHPTASNIGYLGAGFVKIVKLYKDSYKQIKNVWSGMIRRCYDTRHPCYNNYGGLGITVCKEWHDFSKFFHDFKQLDGYDYLKFISNELQLDKDKLQSNINKCDRIYSKDTCVLLTKYENMNLCDIVRDFIVTDPTGMQSTQHNMSTFAKLHGLTTSSISYCLSGKLKTHKGYKFKPIEKCND